MAGGRRKPRDSTRGRGRRPRLTNSSSGAGKKLDMRARISKLRPRSAREGPRGMIPKSGYRFSEADHALVTTKAEAIVKVIASTLRKGNIVEIEDRLYVILSAENIHPGKGTPVTQLDMRRISDGTKVSQRYKTTEQVERAHVEDREFQFLYNDGDGFHFMNTDTYDQIAVPEDTVGDQSAYLQPEMKVKLSVYEGSVVSIELPQRVTLEVVDTEPVTKGQTASSSYKPARLSNGVRTAVPPHVTTGTRIVVMTADGSYVERAKD